MQHLQLFSHMRKIIPVAIRMPEEALEESWSSLVAKAEFTSSPQLRRPSQSCTQIQIPGCLSSPGKSRVQKFASKKKKKIYKSTPTSFLQFISIAASSPSRHSHNHTSSPSPANPQSPHTTHFLQETFAS